MAIELRLEKKIKIIVDSIVILRYFYNADNYVCSSLTGDNMLKLFLAFVFLSTSVFAKPANILLTENNSVVFNQKVTEAYASAKALEVITKSRKASPIFLVLDTPGGSVMAGLRFVDIIKATNIPIHTITVFAASMGYQFVQQLGTRYILNSGVLMSHRGAISGLSGQVPGELNSRLSHIEALLNRMSEDAAKRVGVSKEVYEALVINELWLSGKDAVAKNHADQIANVKCSDELIKGSYKQDLNTLFGKVTLKFSKCPMISFPVGVEFGKSVKPENFLKINRLIKLNRRRINLTL